MYDGPASSIIPLIHGCCSPVLNFFIAKADETGILFSALFDLQAGSEARENGRDAQRYVEEG
jgi:hypothetical protein